MKGLYNKYLLRKTDGTPMDPNAEYFILRLDDQCKDKIHLEACREAMKTYLQRIQSVKPLLAQDISQKWNLP